jgi:hypothetical protein
MLYLFEQEVNRLIEVEDIKSNFTARGVNIFLS